MSDFQLRDAVAADYPVIVALNTQQVQHTSEMDLQRLGVLAALAWSLRVAVLDGEVGGFLLAMRRGCGYANANFEWFQARCTDFAYIDRVVVDARLQGQGLGAALYRDLFARTQQAGIARVTCEYNQVPLNAGSAAFHARMGFEEAGRQWLGEGKQVSMQWRSLDAPDHHQPNGGGPQPAPGPGPK